MNNTPFVALSINGLLINNGQLTDKWLSIIVIMSINDLNNKLKLIYIN